MSYTERIAGVDFDQIVHRHDLERAEQIDRAVVCSRRMIASDIRCQVCSAEFSNARAVQQLRSPRHRFQLVRFDEETDLLRQTIHGDCSIVDRITLRPGATTRASRRRNGARTADATIRSRCRVIVVCVCLLTAVAVGAAQQAPVFRTGVDLVAVDVIVVDRDGAPVRGLSAADFVVTLEGQRRPVEAVNYLEFGATSAPAVDAPPSRTTTNEPARAPASRGARTVVFLVDDLSAKPTQGKALRIAAERVLASLDPTDLVGVTSTSGLGPVVNPTRDRAAVAAALASKDLTGRDDDTTAPFYITVPEAMEIERGMPPDTLSTSRRASARSSTSDARGVPGAGGGAGRRLARYAVHRAASQISSYLTVIRALRAAPAPRVVIALTSGLATGTDKSVAGGTGADYARRGGVRRAVLRRDGARRSHRRERDERGRWLSAALYRSHPPRDATRATSSPVASRRSRPRPVARPSAPSVSLTASCAACSARPRASIGLASRR